MTKYIVVYVNLSKGVDCGGIYSEKEASDIILDGNNMVIRCEPIEKEGEQ